MVTLLEAVGYCWFWWWFQHKNVFSWSYNHCCIHQFRYMSLSVTMISARDASTSEKILNILYNRSASLICTLWLQYNLVEISHDLLRSHKIFWGLTRYTEILSINWFDILHLIFYTWHLTFDIDMLWHLTIDIWHWNWITWHSVMILARTYLIFIDGFWGNISNLETFSHSVGEQFWLKTC